MRDVLFDPFPRAFQRFTMITIELASATVMAKPLQHKTIGIQIWDGVLGLENDAKL
jgi:hypothetical protein